MAYYRDGEFDSFNPDETVGFSHSFAGLSANLEKPNGWAYGENNQSSMDLHVSRMREYPSEDMRILPPISPYAGIHIRDVDDFFPRGFTCEELDRVYHKLLGYDEPKMYGLVAEAAEPFEAMDDYYNPGTETVSDAAIFEAIVVEHFSKTEHRMQAVKRAFKKYMGDSEIQVLDPIVGKPKTTGGFAYVTVQFPFTDGQVITIVFHSPEGDKKKIGPQDQIIAYQWLLNKRDITEVVAPENGKEISLENICKKTSQLLIKNSKRFEKQQKQAIEEKKQLTELTAQVKEAEAHQAELMDQVAAQQQTKSDLELELSQTLALVEKQKAINAELQATLDGLRKGAKKAEKAPAGNTIAGFDRNALIAEAHKKNAKVVNAGQLISRKQYEQMSNVELLCAAGKYADLSFDEQDNQATLFFENAKKLAKDNDAASLKKMAKDNNTTAMVALYYQYKEANNPDEAFKWYQKAAEAGNVAAQRDMPLLLHDEGVDLNTIYDLELRDRYLKKRLEKSNYWLKKAAEQGSIAAIQEFNDNDIILNKEVIVGVIPSNIAEAVPGMIAAPIVLDTKGTDHIQEIHHRELKQRDMSPMEYVQSVIDNFDSIYADKEAEKTDRFHLVCRNAADPADRVIIGVQMVGNSYRVLTATPIASRHLDKMKLLWDGTATSHHTNSEESYPKEPLTRPEQPHEGNIPTSPAEVNPSGEKNSKLTPEPAYMAEIQDIIDGKQDAMGSKAMRKRLQEIFALSKKDGTADTVEPKLRKAAGRVTMLMKKEHE